MSDLRPPVLHRAALERVLQRAAELHAAGTEVPETLSEADLIALGAEVGISATALRQALAEERMRIDLPEERGFLAQAAGPANFAAARVISGTPAAILTQLHERLVEEENLREVRRFPDRVVWGPRGGFAGAIRELTRLDGRGFPLGRADEVSATAVAVDGGRTHVRLEAKLHGRRISAAQSGGIGVFFGGVIAIAGLAITSIVGVDATLGAAVSGAAGLLVALTSTRAARNAYRRDARLAQLAIEQALDRLEFGEPTRRSLFSRL